MYEMEVRFYFSIIVVTVTDQHFTLAKIYHSNTAFYKQLRLGRSTQI